jgi:hypothetical protein
VRQNLADQPSFHPHPHHHSRQLHPRGVRKWDASLLARQTWVPRRGGAVVVGVEGIQVVGCWLMTAGGEEGDDGLGKDDKEWID